MMRLPVDEKLVIRAVLRSPAILGRRLMLDGVLANAIFQRTGCLDVAHDQLPIASRDGIACVSAALSEGRRGISTEIRTKSLRGLADMVAHGIVSEKAAGTSTSLVKGPFRNVSTAFEVTECTALWWAVVGNGAVIENLLQDVYSVGAKTNAGFGRVLRWTVEKVPGGAGPNSDWHGWLDVQGNPIRPLPLDIWRSAFPLKEPLAVDMECIRPPYWRHEDAVLSVLPIGNAERTEKKMRGRLGLQ